MILRRVAWYIGRGFRVYVGGVVSEGGYGILRVRFFFDFYFCLCRTGILELGDKLLVIDNIRLDNCFMEDVV